MGWGCNATFEVMKCRYCGGPSIDDRDEGLSTHEWNCPEGDLWVRFLKLFGLWKKPSILPEARVIK